MMNVLISLCLKYIQFTFADYASAKGEITTAGERACSLKESPGNFYIPDFINEEHYLTFNITVQ